MNKMFSRPVITADAIRKRIKEVGQEISADYEGKDLLLIGVLKGAYTFFADLSRRINIPVTIDFIILSSYGMRDKTSGKVNLIADITENIEGRDVLIIEDIVDSGITIAFLKEKLMEKKPASLKVCTLLDKDVRRKKKVTIDYVCFKIGDEFVVGYGLDYQNRFRNLPYVAALEMMQDGARRKEPLADITKKKEETPKGT